MKQVAGMTGGVAVIGLLASMPLLTARGSALDGRTVLAPPAAATKADTERLKRLALEALVIQGSVGSDPSKVVWGVRDVSRAPAVDEHDAARLPRPSARELDAWRRWWHAKINERFIGAAVRGRLEYALTNTVAARKDPSTRQLGSGISRITFTSALVGPRTAEVTATTDEWAESVGQQWPGGPWLLALPESTMNVDVKFVKSASGQWTVEDMVSSFASGSGP